MTYPIAICNTAYRINFCYVFSNRTNTAYCILTLSWPPDFSIRQHPYMKIVFLYFCDFMHTKLTVWRNGTSCGHVCLVSITNMVTTDFGENHGQPSIFTLTKITHWRAQRRGNAVEMCHMIGEWFQMGWRWWSRSKICDGSTMRYNTINWKEREIVSIERTYSLFLKMYHSYYFITQWNKIRHTKWKHRDKEISQMISVFCM